MSDCQRINSLITPYVDDVLDASSREGVDRHVAACPPCRTRLVEERTARAAIRRCAESLGAPLPPGLQSRCEALAREAAPGRAWRRVLRPMGIGAAVAAAALILVMIATSQSNGVLAAQLAADHVKCFSIFPPRDWSGIEHQQAEQELAANGWTMHVPPTSAANNLKLLGVRGCLTGAGAIPHVLYESNGKPLSLFKLEGARGVETLQIMGKQCRIWQRDNSTFVLVAEGDAGPELGRVAQYVEREAR